MAAIRHKTPIISFNGLSSRFGVPTREAELRAAIVSFFQRTYQTVNVVAGISFEIQAGKIDGLLDPNGTGKTTTHKMISGLLHQPRFLFIDEPSIGLDLSKQNRIRQFIVDLTGARAQPCCGRSIILQIWKRGVNGCRKDG